MLENLLFAVAGNIACRVISERLFMYIAAEFLPERQCGFRDSRNTTNMLFSARQHWFTFTKAFDLVNRVAL